MTLTQTIPAMPVRDMPAAVAFYRDRLGFGVLHHDGGFAVLSRDEAVVHLWESGDEMWRERSDVADRPVSTGAESCIAGTASFRCIADPVAAARSSRVLTSDGGDAGSRRAAIDHRR